MAAPTIDDAVAAFMACEPGDLAARGRLRECLWTLVRDRTLSTDVRAALADAIALLDEPRQFTESREVEGLEQVRLFLEVAVDLAEGAPACVGIELAPTPTSCEFTIATDADDSMLTEFGGEARNLLQGAETALLRLESDPDDTDAVNEVFRAFHTIKGTSSFLALDPIASFAHHAEDMLDRVRAGRLSFAGSVPELALRAVDLLKALVRSIPAAQTGTVPLPEDFSPLQEAMAHPEVQWRPTPQRPGDEVAESVAATVAAPSTLRAVLAAAETGEGTVKVRAERLDRLVEMVGELAIAQRILAEHPAVRDATEHDLTRRAQQVERIVRELHDLALGLRMMPLKGGITKLARLVRDLSARSGKAIAFEMAGEETELDRTLVDLIADPLMHMVRNSVDHGIESPADRAAAGKPAIATVRIAASQSGDRVLVRLSDDGRGLQRDKIIAKAIERGLIATGEGMHDAEVFELIFAPGFSTAEAVTDVSGRGVGMDVVRRNLIAMRGRTVIESVAGQGTSITIDLPLTLAITDGMVVRVGAQRFILPTAHIRRCFRPGPDALFTAHGRGELVRQGDEVLPLLRLHRELRVEGARLEVLDGILVVVGDGHLRVALLVDELLGQQQVVAKSLGESIGLVRGITGGAILGDGRVGLILDIDELVQGSRAAAIHVA